jgi:cation diffusion facilitator CzcD-associated flavoprotein CzcO
MSQIKSVAVIGAGPGGAITVDALAQEKSFDVIRVFDRQEHAGGCWYVIHWYKFVNFRSNYQQGI